MSGSKYTILAVHIYEKPQQLRVGCVLRLDLSRLETCL